MKLLNQTATILNPTTHEQAVEGLRLIEYAGRNCYRSQHKITDVSYKEFVQNLISRGHESPLEFMDITVELTTSRDVLCEITRHRLASFAVQSQRYVKDNATGDIGFIRPKFYLDENIVSTDVMRYCASREWDRAMREAEKFYNDMLSVYHLSAQDARKVLPNSTATVIVMKANLREWRHIIDLRTSDAVYPETREAIGLIRDEMKKMFEGEENS